MKSINFQDQKKSDIIIISSPSGAGKTTVTRKLLQKIKNSSLSISCTTRKPRIEEINGKDYYFITKEKFIKLKKKKNFLETEVVFGNYYGTLKKEVFAKSKLKKTVFLDVDWKGARTLRNILNNQCYSVFLLPPSIKVLKKRLINRHKDNRKIALKRFLYAKNDIKHWSEYDLVVVNQNLNKCVDTIKKKILDIKKKNIEKTKIKKFIEKLLKSKLV